MLPIQLGIRRHATRSVCSLLALLSFVVAVPRPASAQFLKRIKDAAAQMAAERTRQAAGGVAGYRLEVFVTDWSEPQAALHHSARRADAVLAALVARGVSPTRLSAAGRGIGLVTRIELNPAL